MTKWALFLQPVENSGNFFPLQHQSPSNLQQSQIQQQLSTFSPFLSLALFFFPSLTNIFCVFLFFRWSWKLSTSAKGVWGQGVPKKSGGGRSGEKAEDYKGNCKKEQIHKPEREKTTEFLCELQ